MNRGEVWWIRFDSLVGGEIQKTRPAIILSNDRSNKYLNRVQVVPLSSKVDRLYPSEVFVTLEGKKAKVAIRLLCMNCILFEYEKLKNISTQACAEVPSNSE